MFNMSIIEQNKEFELFFKKYTIHSINIFNNYHQKLQSLSNACKQYKIDEINKLLNNTELQKLLKQYPELMPGLQLKIASLDEHKLNTVLQLFIDADLNLSYILLNLDIATSTTKLISEAKNTDLTICNENNVTPLFRAASSLKTSERVALTMTQKTLLQQTNDDFSNTPLHLVIANEMASDSIFMIETAQQKKFSLPLNTKDGNGRTPLSLACCVRDEETVEKILSCKQEGVDLNIADKNGWTALHYACILGLAKSTKALIAAGASCSIRDNDKRTPLDYLNHLSEKHPLTTKKTVQSVLQSVAINPERDVNARFNDFVNDKTCDLPLLLVKQGADKYKLEFIELSSKRDDKILSKLKTFSKKTLATPQEADQYFNGLKRSKNANAAFIDKQKQFLSSTEVFEQLFKDYDNFKGISLDTHCLNQLDNCRETLAEEIKKVDCGLELRNAVAAGDKDKFSAIMSRSDVESFINGCGKTKNTALHFAVRASHNEKTKFTQTLIDRGADTNALNQDNNSPLHNACEKANLSCITILLDTKRCDTAVMNKGNKTPYQILKNLKDKSSISSKNKQFDSILESLKPMEKNKPELNDAIEQRDETIDLKK